MEEVAGLKENVNPRGGLLAPSSRRERRLKLGGGAQEPRSRERAGVLAPNSTLGNGGGVDPLEWLKGRLSQHQSVSKSQLELDSGSRHLRKFGSSHAENGELLGGLGKPSAGLSSKKMGGMAAGREQSSSFLSHHSPSHSRASILHSHSHNSVDNAERTTKNNRSSTGVHVGGAKSPWPVSVYQDDSINSQVQRGLSRREANAKAVEVKSPGAVRLIAKGLAIEEHSKVGLNPSPSGTFLSKSQLQQDQVCVKQLSPQQSHSTGSGLWNGSKRQGTPYKRKVHKFDNSVVDQPERSNVDQQNSGSGQGKGLRLIESERARSSGTSPGRREVSRREVMVEAVEEKSPVEADARTGSPSKSHIDDRGNQMFSSKCEEIKSRIEQLAADTVTRSASRSQINENGNQSFPTKCEEIKSRIEQHKIKLKQLYSRKPSSSGESGRSSFSNLQGPLCTYTSPMPEKEEVASSPDVKIPQCEEKQLPETVLENEKDGMDFSVNLPYVSPELHLREVYHHELGQKMDCGSRAAPCENISKYASGYSEDSANKVSLRRGSSPPPAKTQSASTGIAGSGNRKWSGSGAMSSQAEAHYSRSEHVPLHYGLKQNTSNMDVTAVGNDSALLSAEVTAASSSGSSSTPCVMGNSSLDDVTVKSHENVLPTPSAEKALSSSYRLSAVHKLSRVNKRSGSLGPPLRVLRDEAESSSDGISPVSVAPIIGSDCSAVMEVEVKKNCWQLDHPWSDPRKRKAERDLSGGDGDTSQILEQSCSAPASALDKVIERAVEVQRKSSGEPRDVGSMHKERPSRSISKEDAGEFAHPRMPSKLVERAMGLHPKISTPGRLMHSEQLSSVLITSKATTLAAYAGRQSRSTPAQNQNEIDASGAPSDSCKKRDRNPVPMLGGASIGKAGLSVISPIIEPANEIQNADVAQAGGQSDEGSEKRVPATANLEEGRELAVDMSHDGFSSGENKENFVPDLSNGLNSLSLEEEEMLKKTESKLSSKISNRTSTSHSSQLNTLKSVANCHAPQSTSHSARSGVSIEMGSRGQVQILGNESAEKPPPSASVLSENPGCELSRNTAGLSKEYNTEVKVRTSPSDMAKDSGANAQAQLTSHGTGKVNGQGASAAQSKISENSHFVWVNDKRYQKIGKIGKGGSSEVYKVIDSDCNIYAMKKINLKGRDHRAAIGFYQEIEYLEKLRGKRNVIQLIHYEVTNRTVVREDYEEEKILEDAYIYMVLEFGEIDLAGILSKKRKEMMENNEIIDDNWLRFYWKHMLLAVKTIHDERIVHADLKPANFLLVQGELKLIDFGIAKAIQSDTTHIVRDSNNMVGTVNYMSPEALMTNSLDDKGEMVKCGRASDIWSLGCILYQMVYGHTPFSQVTSFYAKIQAITSKNHRIEFPPIPDPWLQDVMKKCLIWDRHSRPQITDLLEHPFLRPGLANQQK